MEEDKISAVGWGRSIREWFTTLTALTLFLLLLVVAGYFLYLAVEYVAIPLWKGGRP